MRVSLQSLDGEDAEVSGGFSERFRTKSMPVQLSKDSSHLSQSTDIEIEEQLADIMDESEVFESSDKTARGKIDFSLNYKSATANGPNTLYTMESDSSSSLQDVVQLLKQPGKDVPSVLLQPLNEPVPDNWVTIEDDFVTVVATYLSHLGSDIIMAPDARFTDGLIHLCFIKAGIAKTELLSLMTKLEKGTHIDHVSENLEFVKVLAFRLEPVDERGVIMIDGEKIDCKPVQAQVLPGLANVMAIQWTGKCNYQLDKGEREQKTFNC